MPRFRPFYPARLNRVGRGHKLICLYAYAPNPLIWVDPWGWSCGITGAISWKGFNPQKRDYNINGVVYQNLTGLQYHYKKHGREFGDITQIQYLNKAKEFAKKPITDTMQEAHINNIVIRYRRSFCRACKEKRNENLL